MLKGRFKFSSSGKLASDKLSAEQQTLLAQMEASAALLGEGCEPLWLKERRIPDFPSTDVGESGPTILLLHGLFGAMSNWDDFIPVASKYARLHALQFPLLTGHRSEVKIKALALYTECYIKLFCQAPVVICGNSLGGHVALRVALAHPELVDCLVLSGSSGLYEHTVDSLPLRPSPEYLRGHLKRVFFNQEFVTDERLDEVVEILKKRTNHVNIISTARSAKHDNLQDELGKITNPTLLLWGENDEVTPMHVAETFHSLMPKSILQAKSQCGHAPMIE